MQESLHFHQHLSTLFKDLSPHKIASFLVPLCYLWLFYVSLAKLHAAVLGLLWFFYHPYILPCLFLFIFLRMNISSSFRVLNHCFLTWMQLERVCCMFSGCIGTCNLKHFQISLNISLLLRGAARKLSFEFTLHFV